MAREPQSVVATRLRRLDRAFSGVISRHGPPPTRRPVPVASRFSTLAMAILHQQLAGAAAAAIHRRVLSCVGDPITASGLLAAGEDDLAACGVSGPKRRSLSDLAAKTLDGTVDLASLGRRTDDEVTAVLTSIRGIGPWTAHMFCITALARPDVWPTGDFGVRAGWTALHGGGEMVTPNALYDLGERFRPHRSAVAWYCWRALEDDRADRPAQ